MNTFGPHTSTDTTIQTIQTLGRLEATIARMWSSEPLCDLDERRVLFGRLRDVSIEVERLAFRHEFEPEAAANADVLDFCVSEVDALSGRWTDLDIDPDIDPDRSGEPQARRAA